MAGRSVNRNLLHEALTDPFLAPREVAQILGVSVRTINEWARNGKIPSVRTAGGHHRFRHSDVKAMLDGQ